MELETKNVFTKMIKLKAILNEFMIIISDKGIFFLKCCLLGL